MKKSLVFLCCLFVCVSLFFVYQLSQTQKEIADLLQKEDKISKVLDEMTSFLSDGKYDKQSCPTEEFSVIKQTIEKSMVWIYTKSVFQYGKKKEGSDELEHKYVSEITATAFVVNLPDGFPPGKYILALAHTSSTKEASLNFRVPGGVSSILVTDRVSESTWLFKDEKNEEMKEIEIKPIFTNHEADVALFKFPDGDDIDIPALSLKFGNSDELELGDRIVLFGRHFNVEEVNIRPGVVTALDGLKRAKIAIKKGATEIKRPGVETDPENSNFVANNLIYPGDSGCPAFALRDGQYELVGMAQSMMGPGISFFLRINFVLDIIKKHFESD